MTTFNGERFLQAQLDSFAWQTRLPDELIVCDDGSTDGSVNIVKEFASNAPFAVRLFVNSQNLGFTQNFAKALSYCSGDLVFLSDQDDVWFRTKLEVMTKLFERLPDCWIAVHDGEIVDEHLNSAGVSKLAQIRRGYGTVELATTGTLTTIRRQLLHLALPIPISVTGHDRWLHALARAFPSRRYVLEECLQSIRRHGSNTSEWVANRDRPINGVDVFFSQLRTAPAESYGDQIALNENLQARLRAFIAVANDSDRVSTSRHLVFLEQQRIALDARQRLVVAGRFQRWRMSIDMLARGQYAYFNGYRSFLRDVLRR